MSWIVRLAWLAWGLVALALPAFAQTPLPPYEPYRVQSLTFRPGSADELLFGLTDDEGRLQFHLVRLDTDGKATVERTLPGFHHVAAWLDANTILTASEKRLQKWPAAGGAASTLLSLDEQILGIGVAPRSRMLALRQARGPLRFFTPEGRPGGASIALGPSGRPNEDCTDTIAERDPAFSADDRLVAFTSPCGDLRVSAREGGRLVRPEVPRPYVKRHVFSSDGKTILATYFGEPGGGADFWPIFGGRIGNPQRLPGPIEHNDPADAAALPGGGFVVLTTNRLRFFGADSKLARPDVAIAQPMRVAVSDDGKRIAVAAQEGIVGFDSTGKRLVDRPFAEWGVPVAAAALPGGREFVAISREGIARIFGRDGRQTREPMEIWSHDKLATDWYGTSPRLLVSPNGRNFAVFAPTGRFEIFDQNFARLGRPFMFPNEAGSVQTTSLLDDRILRPLPQGVGFILFAYDGRMIGRLPLSVPPRGEPQIASSANGTIATWAWDRKFRLWSGDGKLIGEAPLDYVGPADRMVMSADGKVVAMHGGLGYGDVLLWRPASGAPPERLKGDFVRLMPDGRLVRFHTGKLSIGSLSSDIDAERIYAVTDDGTAALAEKNGTVRLVTIGR